MRQSLIESYLEIIAQEQVSLEDVLNALYNDAYIQGFKEALKDGIKRDEETIRYLDKSYE